LSPQARTECTRARVAANHPKLPRKKGKEEEGKKNEKKRSTLFGRKFFILQMLLKNNIYSTVKNLCAAASVTLVSEPQPPACSKKNRRGEFV
jgi:hypothetical protein